MTGRTDAHLFTLENGGFGLIDATQDREATAIRTALARHGGSAGDVQAVFLTHWHYDHAAGARSFPNAKVYVLQPDAALVERQGIPVERGLTDGESVDVSGTKVEVFGLPGHTPGSAAYLVHGVLFLGDSASSIYDGSVAPNRLISEDADQTERALRELVERLRSRRTEIRHIAFGHQGAVKGLEPLLDWAVR